MLSWIIMIGQIVFIIFIGAFSRTSAAISDLNFLWHALLIQLAFVLICSTDRRLNLFSLSILLLVISVSIQTNILFGTFWDSCFNGFSSSFNVTIILLVRSAYASCCALLTCLDFYMVFCFWQPYITIAFIMTIGYGLNSAILIYGIKIFDGGGCLQLFMFSGVCSFMIWLIVIRNGVSSKLQLKKSSYINQTFSLIGLILALISWPQFNMIGAKVSFINTVLTSSTSLEQSAVINTIIGLLTAIMMSMVLTSGNNNESKMKVKVFIDCFLNTGIAIASFSDISLYPVIGMIIAMFISTITILIDKYVISQPITENQSQYKSQIKIYIRVIYRSLIPLVGIIICSIVVSSRVNISPQLISSDYSSKAGLQIAAFFITLLMAVFFGALAGFAIKFINTAKSNNASQKLNTHIQDQDMFDALNEDMHPLYCQVFEKKQTLPNSIDEQCNKKIIRESFLRYQPEKIVTVAIQKNIRTKVNVKGNQTNSQEIKKHNLKQISEKQQHQDDTKLDKSKERKKKKIEEIKPIQNQKLIQNQKASINSDLQTISNEQIILNSKTVLNPQTIQKEQKVEKQIQIKDENHNLNLEQIRKSNLRQDHEQQSKSEIQQQEQIQLQIPNSITANKSTIKISKIQTMKVIKQTQNENEEEYISIKRKLNYDSQTSQIEKQQAPVSQIKFNHS